MTNKIPQLGDIYQTHWDNSICRIIGLDNNEIHYDGFWPHDNSWTFSGNFKRKCYFYRTSYDSFIHKATFLRNLPLDENELNFFQPNLPLSICRSDKISWTNFTADSFTIVREELDSNSCNTLNAKEIFLVPYGKKGGMKKSIKVVADNMMNFKCSELVYKAKQIQEDVNDDISNGIGIFRLGFEKGIPSYYIGKYYDDAGILDKNGA